MIELCKLYVIKLNQILTFNIEGHRAAYYYFEGIIYYSNRMTTSSTTASTDHEICVAGSDIFKNYLDMPVWQLRHLQVSRFIEKHQISKVLDIGCAEGTLINRLSRSYELEKLIGIDFD